MAKSKIAITLDAGILRRVDEMVRKGLFPNRSRAVEAALEEALARRDRIRLAEECAKLDPAAEKALAEESVPGGLSEWPEY